MRLIKDGHKIAFLSSIRIIHSHNRPSYYFLKRGYVDSIFLSSMFPDFFVPDIRMSDVVKSIIFTYSRIYSIINNLNRSINLPCDVDYFKDVIDKKLKSNSDLESEFFVDLSDNRYIDGNFKLFLENIFVEYSTKEGGVLYNNILVDAMVNFMDIVFEYMRKSYELIDEYILEDFKACVFKVFAILCGSHIAYCYLKNPENENQKLLEINNDLTKGV